MKCISRTVQYGLDYILGMCNCLQVFVCKRHFSHPFLGTYEVHQFLDLGYLEGTHSGGGI